MKELKKSDYFGIDEISRIQQMNADCEPNGKKENHTYFRSLSTEEVDLNNNLIHQSFEEINLLKEQIKDLNAEKKELEKTIAKAHDEVHSGQIKKVGTIWQIVNDGFLETINQEGYVIESKRHSEMKNMFNNKKAM